PIGGKIKAGAKRGLHYSYTAWRATATRAASLEIFLVNVRRRAVRAASIRIRGWLDRVKSRKALILFKRSGRLVAGFKHKLRGFRLRVPIRARRRRQQT
ncbi:MAG: hypothetical protein ACTSUS_07400, partial [Candidatus Freyarchaeota archaeon]